MLSWALAAFIFFLRYPDNATAPNFYAEDGRDFMAHILDQGPLRALFNPFNGYFIIGVYLIGDIARCIDWVFFRGAFIELPRSIAIASYLFLGLCAALPIITLNRILKPAFLGLAVLALMFVPMPLNDYVVIGTLGNLKFAFGFIAMLLIAKRWSLKRESRLIPLIDLGVLTCAYTTATVYLLLPFYLFCDGLRPKQLLDFKKYWRVNNVSLWSTLVLGVVAILQLAYVAIHGIPKLPGYLDTPFQTSKAVEIFIGRSILFVFVGPFFKYLNDALAILGAVLLLVVVVRFARRWILLLAALGTFNAVMASGLFLINRPGLSSLFPGYSWPGPDQFFYAQTMMMVVTGIVLLQAVILTTRKRGMEVISVLVVCLGIALTAPHASSYGHDKSMEQTRGTIYADAKVACKLPVQNLKIDIYPTTPWQMTAKRSEVCTPDLYKHKTYHVKDLGLTVAVNQPINIAEHSISQPFTIDTSSGPLAGLNIFLSTYQKRLSGEYKLVIFGPDCRTKVTDAVFKGSTIRDNSFAEMRFAPIAKSGVYCFTVKPVEVGEQALAMQLSSTDNQAIMPALADGSQVKDPVAFSLVFEDQ
jgi:hypothetical protein